MTSGLHQHRNEKCGQHTALTFLCQAPGGALGSSTRHTTYSVRKRRKTFTLSWVEWKATTDEVGRDLYKRKQLVGGGIAQQSETTGV